MAKSRRKAGGATRGRFKLKNMGKGWATQRGVPGFRPAPNPPKPKDAKDRDEQGESKSNSPA